MSKLFTVKALAELFDKEEQTIVLWIKDGVTFPNAFKVRGGWYVPLSDIRKLMKQNKPATDEAPRARAGKGSGFVREW